MSVVETISPPSERACNGMYDARCHVQHVASLHASFVTGVLGRRCCDRCRKDLVPTVPASRVCLVDALLPRAVKTGSVVAGNDGQWCVAIVALS